MKESKWNTNIMKIVNNTKMNDVSTQITEETMLK
jgi:hypothetical protein